MLFLSVKHYIKTVDKPLQLFIGVCCAVVHLMNKHQSFILFLNLYLLPLGSCRTSHQWDATHQWPAWAVPPSPRPPPARLLLTPAVAPWTRSKTFFPIKQIKHVHFVTQHMHDVYFTGNVSIFLCWRTPENSSRASSPSCSDYENFPLVATLETSYLARAGKNEFLNLVPDIEEMRPG